MNNEDQKTEEIKPGRDYEFEEVSMESSQDFKPGDMIIFRNDLSDKGWEVFKSFLAESPSFMKKHRVDEPGGPSWNEYAKFFCREFAWAAEFVLNKEQIKIINLKNRLKKKIIKLPVECVLVRMIKN